MRMSADAFLGPWALNGESAREAGQTKARWERFALIDSLPGRRHRCCRREEFDGRPILSPVSVFKKLESSTREKKYMR